MYECDENIKALENAFILDQKESVRNYKVIVSF